MAEKGKSTLEINRTESAPGSNGLHAYADMAPPSQPQLVTAGGLGGELAKRRRGRPRKNDAAEKSVVPPVTAAAAAPPLMCAPPVSQVVSGTPAGFTFAHSSVDNPANRAWGRGSPQASGNWLTLASNGGLFANSGAGQFRVQVVDAYPGEDIMEKISSLIQGRTSGVCVLSANGIVANVALHHPGCFGGIVRYEGRFEILSLNGSSTSSEVGGVRRRTGGFSVSLAGPQGQVIGGGVAGPLVAAGPVQMMVGSLMTDTYTEAASSSARHHPQ